MTAQYHVAGKPVAEEEQEDDVAAFHTAAVHTVVVEEAAASGATAHTEELAAHIEGLAARSWEPAEVYHPTTAEATGFETG